MTSSSSTFEKLLTSRGSRRGLWLLPLVIAIAMALWLAATTSQFGQSSNLADLVAQGMPLLITAVGQMFVVLVGGLDLSIGSVVSFTTAMLALDLPGFVTIPAVFVLAGLIGATNGYCVTRLSVHPIVATLSMQYIVLGITRVLRPVSGGAVPDSVRWMVEVRSSAFPCLCSGASSRCSLRGSYSTGRATVCIFSPSAEASPRARLMQRAISAFLPTATSCLPM